MIKNNRGFLIATAVAMMALSACEASREYDQSNSDATSNSSASPSSEDIAKAHAPKDEQAFIKAHELYQADVNGPNNIVIEDLQAKKAKVWKQTVLAVGRMKGWSATVNDIRDDGRITLELPSGMRVWADIPTKGDLFNVIKTLSDRTEDPVFFTSKINQTNIDSTQSSDDSNFPTCFEDGMGVSGCEIDLESIKPIAPTGDSSSS